MRRIVLVFISLLTVWALGAAEKPARLYRFAWIKEANPSTKMVVARVDLGALEYLYGRTLVKPKNETELGSFKQWIRIALDRLHRSDQGKRPFYIKATRNDDEFYIPVSNVEILVGFESKTAHVGLRFRLVDPGFWPLDSGAPLGVECLAGQCPLKNDTYQTGVQVPLPGASQKKINRIDGKVLVYIPEGHLAYGQPSNASSDNYNPNFYAQANDKLMRIAEFYIYRDEVTHGDFAKFLQATGYDYPLRNQLLTTQGAALPVTKTSYDDAKEYCAWAGGSLPSEFQWETAARGHAKAGGTGRSYPWGNNWSPALCPSLESGGSLIPVDKLPAGGMSPFKVNGMCGNAPEWTRSWYKPYLGTWFRSRYMGKRFKVIRGGGAGQDHWHNTTYTRAWGGYPDLSQDRRAGFRCIQNVQ